MATQRVYSSSTRRRRPVLSMTGTRGLINKLEQLSSTSTKRDLDQTSLGSVLCAITCGFTPSKCRIDLGWPKTVSKPHVEVYFERSIEFLKKEAICERLETIWATLGPHSVRYFVHGQ